MDSIKIDVGGIFVSLLTILFIYLKLTNQVTWSWLWVLSPLWIGAVVVIILILFAVIIYFVVSHYYLK